MMEKQQAYKINGYTVILRANHFLRCLLAIIFIPVIFLYQFLASAFFSVCADFSETYSESKEMMIVCISMLTVAVTGKATKKQVRGIYRMFPDKIKFEDDNKA